MSKKEKRKKINYALIDVDSPPGEAMYPMLEQIVGAHHEDLDRTNARIALAWAMSWKADADGIVKLGQCKKASDLDRELAAFDFIVLLNMEWWQDAEVTDDQRRALLDHELCHAALKYDTDGDAVRDEKGRYVYRTRKHDIEEFSSVVERHGLYKRDLERFYAAIRSGKQGRLPLQELDDKIDVARLAADPKIREAVRRMAPRPGSGIESVTIGTPGGKQVTLTQADRKRMDDERRSH